MRHPYLVRVTAAAVLALALADQVQAQNTGVGADPFSFYYGYYLPHQAAMAAQPHVGDQLNQIVATRQYTAQTDRTQLFDPISPYGDAGDETDPLRPNSSAARGGAGRQPLSFGYGQTNSAITGNGPSLYYNRTARYFPSLRPGSGRGPNRNLSQMRAGRGGGMGMPSMGGMGMGMY
jgi:hypothetical protein